MLAAVAGGRSLVDAIDAPRVHAQSAGDGFALAVEAALVDEIEASGLAADLGLTLVAMPDRSMYFGGVGAALTTYAGALEAVADPRREGVARITPGRR